ncbi:MAG TPA: fibronectin type III domain-containing protein, partial [Planctomycetaceae bacterium]
MRRLALSLALLVAAPAYSEEVPPSQAVFRPTPVPDRVLLSWSGDPATTASVSWRTDASVTKAFAEIAPAGPGPDFKEDAKAVEAATQPLETTLGVAHYHAVTFEGLTPDTLYAYRVGDGTSRSEWFQFRTASDRPAPLRFIYVGDAQTDIKSLWSRVIRQAYADAPTA